MKKYIVAFLIGIVAFGFFKLKFNPESILLRHLEKKYNKEFVIAYGGKRSIGISSWYEAEIYPKELVGTPKEKDKYYWAKGFVENGKGGDTYGKVLLNESANNFYLPKLKELFGENVLPVLDLKGGYIEEDYVKEMELRNKLYKERPDGNFNPLSGGIYIFGRVESDEDREWYRKQIYEFVQFMKQTGTFEYVSIQFKILDERCLTNYFKENKEKLLKAKLVYNTSSDFIAYRQQFLEKAEEEFNQMSEAEKKNRIDSYLKSDFIPENLVMNGENSYSALYYSGIVSPKFQEIEPRATGKKRYYNSINDIKLLNVMKNIYKEYELDENSDIIEE